MLLSQMVATPVKWTEIASVVVATIAATFAYRGYRKQAGRLELAQKHDLRRQSGLFTGWIAAYKGEQSPYASGPLRYGSAKFSFINASDLPVYNVVVTGSGFDFDLKTT
ncbi:hypothetical protein ACH347_30035 [Saccharopolyspora sp. 5N102]|uniref:hypothetical protein n=1 Tax=Saccharopolyspora sp. 5N102 TaxID=3375155 RepID=UPI0037B16EAF